MQLSKRTRAIFKWGIVTCTGVIAAVIVCNAWMVASGDKWIVGAGDPFRPREVALVLGTSPRVGAGKNPFFEARMDAAAKLWRLGKVRHFLLSGDNRRHDYDEPTAMRDALIGRGVPANALSMDYAGLRTLDSVVRAREVFGLARVTIVTDRWHQPRALFLAHASGLDAVGFCTGDVPWGMSVRTRVREWFSRVKAVLDVWVLRKRPKFLGERVRLPE